MSLSFGFLGGVEKIDGERLSPDRQHTVSAADSVDDAYHNYEEGWRRRWDPKVLDDEQSLEFGF